MTSLTSLFGADSAHFIEPIDGLALLSYKTRYKFTSVEDFDRVLRDVPARGMQTYWTEILARSHLTAVTAILRSRHWINAAVASAESKNLLAFAASLRGLIESAADASTALQHVPITLAQGHAKIARALSGELKEEIVLVDQIFEDELIHFSHARQLTQAERPHVPASHQARKVRDYIEILDRGRVLQVVDCYRDMCDLTHPGLSSVWMWLHPISELEIVLAPRQDETLIAYFINKYQDMFLRLLMFAFNPAIITLQVLNYFPLEQLHVPALLQWDLSGISGWQGCQAVLKGVPPRARHPLRL